MISRNHGLIRYADDFIILSPTQEKANAALKDAINFLESNLKLRLNKERIVRRISEGFEFLKIWFQGSEVSITGKRQARIIEKINTAIVVKNPETDIDSIIKTLNGIRNYYGRLIGQPVLEKLDEALCSSLTDKLSAAFRSRQIKGSGYIKNYLSKIDFISRSYCEQKSLVTDELYKTITAVLKENKLADDKIVEKQIENKRAKYEAITEAERELVISTPGVFLGKTRKGISVRDKGVKKVEKPLFNLKQITILSHSVSLSGSLIEYCSTNGIPIDFIGFNGLPYAKLFSPGYPEAETGLAQLDALRNGRGTELVKKIIEGKLKNQMALIKYYYKYRKDKDQDYSEAYAHNIAEIENVILKLRAIDAESTSEVRMELMGLEGHASALYWDMVIRLLNNYTVFEKRVHQGADDLVNSMLNYGYGILYSRIWEAVIRAGLNPYISFLHIPRKGEPTLAFDLIEEFRQQSVDRVVFAMITKGEEIELVNGLLSTGTKNRLVEKVLERLNAREKFRNRELRLIEIINYQAKAVISHINGTKTYKPYVAKW